MIINYLSNSQLIAQIKLYDIIIAYSKDLNIIEFRNQCKQELINRTPFRYNLHNNVEDVSNTCAKKGL